METTSPSSRPSSPSTSRTRANGRRNAVSRHTTFTDLARKSEIYALIRDHVGEVNQDLPEAARISAFLLLHKELHADDAELTRTRKVRRDFIRSRFEDLIGGLYSEDDAIRVETEITYQDGRTAMVAHDLRIERIPPPVPAD